MCSLMVQRETEHAEGRGALLRGETFLLSLTLQRVGKSISLSLQRVRGRYAGSEVLNVCLEVMVCEDDLCVGCQQLVMRAMRETFLLLLLLLLLLQTNSS